MSIIKSLILRRVISSSLFWKLRHIVQPKWILDYAKAKKNITFIENLVSEKNIISILDFGCASGRTLFKIKEANPHIKIYGVDINEKAIDYCKNHAENYFTEGYYFSSELNVKELLSFLKNHNLSKFDLIIFDRVLYCLGELKIADILKKIKDISLFIYLDDFCLSSDRKYIGYVHRDWINIFKKEGYDCQISIPTVQNIVQNADARSMLFKKHE